MKRWTNSRNPANTYYSMAADGVSCTLCHQIADVPELGTDAGYSGHYTVDTYANSVDRRIYGPYDNVFAMPMRNNVSYSISYSPHIKESELCATCHNLYTPYVDGEGNILSTPETEFPEQVPYSEWLASDYANVASCQDCHMPRTDGVVMASRPMWLDTARDEFDTHRLIGGNALGDENFTGGGDEVTFRVSGLPGSRYIVRAELVYQAVSYAFLQDLTRDATTEIDALMAMYSSSSAKAVTMTSGMYTITR